MEPLPKGAARLLRCIGARAALISPLLLAGTLTVTRTALGSEPISIPSLVKQVQPAVISVLVYDDRDNLKVQGSGFFVSADGKVVTNAHVISQGHSFLLKRRDGAFFLVDRVLRADSDHDLALLSAVGEDFPYLVLGDSNSVEIGQEVVAIGSPLALEGSVSSGIVSGLRKLGPDKAVIQTTAPISPGSSGGPLVDRSGRVVGVTATFVPGGENLNFAIPSNYVQKLLHSPPEYTELNHSAVSSPSESSPRTWVSTGTNDRFKIRVSQDTLYIERLFARVVTAETFERCILAKQGSSWKGFCGIGVTLPCNGKAKYCTFSHSFIILRMTRERIDGVWEDFSPGFDCASCRPGRGEQKPFVWVAQE